VHGGGNTTGDAENAYELLTDEQRALINQITIDEAGELTSKQRTRLLNLVARRIRAFSTDGKTPGFTHLLEVSLDLVEGAQPFRHAPTRLGEAGSKIADEAIDDMERHGIIRKSNSPWASRVVLVKKKSGEPRFCIDLRDLNSRLKIQDTPLPRCDDAIDQLGKATAKLGGATWFHTLDLTAGFWTLPIKESHKERLAFVTQRGKWEFNKLPFGLASGPSYMQRLMEATLQGLAWEVCLPYLDDVAIWASGDDPDSAFEQALERLDMVLERFEWAGLTAKAKKCHLFGTRVEYLGHICSREGVSLDPSKINAVKDMDPTRLQTLEDVRSFLGLVGYYRDHIDDFHLISAPLVDLTKKGVDVATAVQSAECQEAARLLIEAMCKDPVLAYPRSDRPFYVKTDGASGRGVGGVLVQMHEDADGNLKERPVAYYGRRLSSAEKNYTVTEIELLAVVECLKKWRPYLWGRHFHLITDHAALKWLHTMRDTAEGGVSSRLTRWIMRLQEYDFEIHHKPGAQHQDADALSRLATPVWTKAPEFEEIDPATCGPGAIAAAYSKVVSRVWKSIHGSASTVGAAPNPEVARRHLFNGSPSLESIREALVDDPEASAVVTYLETQLLPTETRESVATRRLSRQIELRDGLLYRVREAGTTQEATALYIPAEFRAAYLTAFHDRAGHHGRERTYRLMGKHVWWPRMWEDVTDHVNTCHECTFTKRTPRVLGQGHEPHIGDAPFDTVVVDVLSMGKVPTARGHTKILIFADSLTRWIEAVPMVEDPTSEEVLNHFIHYVVARYGLPRAVRSDRGSNLVSALVSDFYEQFDISMELTTADHHQSAGLVERINDTLTHMLKASMHDHPKDWDDHLDFILFSYRATPHRVTTHSPAYLLYGHEMKIPSSTAHSVTSHDGEMTAQQRQVAYRLAGGLYDAWALAKGATLHQQRRDRENTDRTHTHMTLVPNERVLLRRTGLLPKLACEWEGPYRVKAVLGRDNYELTDLHDRRRHPKIHISRLRPYLTATDHERLAPDEYLIDQFLARRDVTRADGSVDRQYKVKWRGYPKAEATWQSRSTLAGQRDALDAMLAAFDAGVDTPAQPPAAAPSPAAPPPPTAAPPPSAAPPTADAEPSPPPSADAEAQPNGLPLAAQLNRGQWYYQFPIPGSSTARGPRLRWFPSSSFTPEELERYQSIHPAAVTPPASTSAYWFGPIRPDQLERLANSLSRRFSKTSLRHQRLGFDLLPAISPHQTTGSPQTRPTAGVTT
jgi:hypothetical protein